MWPVLQRVRPRRSLTEQFIERLMADGRYELIYCSRCATYGMALLTMLDTELSTPLLVYEVTPKYHVAPLVRLFNT